MSNNNNISIQIPEENLQIVRESLANMEAALMPFLLALSPEQRRTIPRMNDGSRPFVAKVMGYATSEPKFVPPFVDVREMQKDWNTLADLVPIFRSVDQIRSLLNDTIMLAGSEVYVASLGYYKSVKLGARMNVPNAKAIHEDLKARFERQGKAKPSLGV